jgi:hypothetical protein
MIASVEVNPTGRAVVAIVNRRGEVASVPVDDIVAGKLFPR